MNRFAALGLLGCGVVLSLSGGVTAQETVSTEPVIDSSESSSASSVDAVQLASLLPSLPKLAAAAMPMALTEDAVSDLGDGDAARTAGDLALAVQRYFDVLDRYPDSPQAETADMRVDFLLHSSSGAELDVMVAALPEVSEFSTYYAKSILMYFLHYHALQLMEAEERRALGYMAEVRDGSFDLFTESLDDPYALEMLNVCLDAADLTGQGARVRARLSAHADTLPVSFLKWLIETRIDGEDGSLELMTSYASRDALREYFRMQALDYTGARADYVLWHDYSHQLLLEQPSDDPGLYMTMGHLEASEALGEQVFSDAVAEVEAMIATNSLSIKYWVMRYELALNYTKPGRSAEDTRKGFAHFEAAVREGTMELMDPIINDTTIPEDVRGVVMCLLGHAYFATNRIVEAEAHYDWVLDYYLKESHAGDSAAFAKANVNERKPNADFTQVATRYESFVTDNPSSAYTTQALMRAAKVRERSGDSNGAITTYERLRDEYPDSGDAEVARTELTRLSR